MHKLSLIVCVFFCVYPPPHPLPLTQVRPKTRRHGRRREFCGLGPAGGPGGRGCEGCVVVERETRPFFSTHASPSLVAFARAHAYSTEAAARSARRCTHTCAPRSCAGAVARGGGWCGGWVSSTLRRALTHTHTDRRHIGLGSAHVLNCSLKSSSAERLGGGCAAAAAES